MKKICCLFFGLTLSAVIVYAQQAMNAQSLTLKPGTDFAGCNQKGIVQIQAQFDTVFYENFGNGLAGTGTNGAWTATDMSVGAFCPWKYTKKSPQGQYSTNALPL